MSQRNFCNKPNIVMDLMVVNTQTSTQKMVFSDAQRAIKWANKHKVPVMLTETGCIGYLDGKEGPKSNDDCGKFAADIQKHYIENGVGVTWWALEKEKTIYDRTCEKDCWMPSKLTPKVINRLLRNPFIRAIIFRGIWRLIRLLLFRR